jgi:bacterioferritin
MKEKSIELLNKAVADELQAVHQYMYFHFHCDNKGYEPLSLLFRKIAIEEMMHIERISERIIFLKGDVEMKPSGEVKKIHNVKEMLECARKMEEDAILTYNKFAQECAQNLDSVSKKLFEDLVVDEERHFDEFDTQYDNIHEFGEQFLALQSIERSKKVAGSGTPNPTA